MSYFVYIIYSASRDRYYVGHCQNLDKRILDHLNSRSGYTKGVKDWELKWKLELATRSEAMLLESKIKKKKSRRYLESLIKTGD